MPFVVANYIPDPKSIHPSKKGRHMGLENHRTGMHLVSKRPIRAVDDSACLRYLDLADSDSEEENGQDWRENGSVSRNFYKK